MPHLPQLILDLASILIAAGVFTVLSKFLKQPIILGYLIAGFLLSPHNTLVKLSIIEVSNIQIWAEIGVIFLLFALGLEFSFKKLLNSGGAIVAMAFLEIPLVFFMGFLIGQILGFTKLDSIFMGAMFSISSSTVIMKTSEDFKMKGRKFINLVYGVCVIEDLIAIMLLVALTTLAATKTFQGSELIFTGFKLFFFLVLWLVSGLFLIPIFMRKVKKLLTEETLLIVALALCLTMVILATSAGFSAAFGAFLMGSILAETPEAEKITHIFKPVRNLFGAIFFVSVGLLIDPQVITDYWWAILLITFVTILGKFIGNSLGSILSGQNLKSSVQAGLTMAPIGEFSFIIATLGLSMKVINEALYPIAVCVSALTIFISPYLLKYSETIYRKFESLLPRIVHELLDRYVQDTHQVSMRTDWQELMRSLVVSVAVNVVIIISIFFLSAGFLRGFIYSYTGHGLFANYMTLAITLVIAAPFIWGLSLHQPKYHLYKKLTSEKHTHGPFIIVGFFRFTITFLLLAVLLTTFVHVGYVFLAIALISALIYMKYSTFFRNAYSWFEGILKENLSHNSNHSAESNIHHLAPWDAHIEHFIVSPYSELVGKTLQELFIRERFGVTIVMLERGTSVTTAPNHQQMLFPYDKVYVIGTDEQIERFKNVCEMTPLDSELVPSNYQLHRYRVTDQSPFLGQTIKNSGIRESTHGLVVGVERAGLQTLNPDSMHIIQQDDILWIVGDKDQVRKLS